MVNRINARWLSLVAVTLICLYLCWLIVAPFMDVILWSAMMAIISYPMFRRWRKRGWGPAMASLFTTLFVVLAVIVPIALVLVMLSTQVDDAVALVQKGIQQLTNPDSTLYSYLNRWVNVKEHLNPEVLGERLKAMGNAIAARSFGLVGNLFGVIVQIFFVLFTVYYLLKDADVIVPAIRDSLPLEKEQAEEVFARTHDVIFASVRGVMVIAAIQGALGGIAFFFLGLPSAILWGVIMFLLSMVPMLGAFLVWGPAAVYLFATGSVVKAIILIIWGGAVIGSVDNFLRPKLVGERTRLHELIIFFAVLGGLQVFGVLGLFVGPVVVAITLSLIDIYKRIGGKVVVPVEPVTPVSPVTQAVQGSKKD
jgi:predicted PurR-regulated permease PerM